MKAVGLPLLLCCGACLAQAQVTNRPARNLNPLDHTLDMYARLTQRTILRPTGLPQLESPITDRLPGDTNAAIRAIEDAFKEKRIELRPDGTKFLRAVPVGWSNSPAAAFLATIKPGAGGVATLPVGVVDWTGGGGVDLLQAFEFYGRLRTRTLLRSAHLQSPTIKLTNITPLTSEELGYALTVVFALNGIAAIDDGEKLVQLVPVRDWKDVKPQAPKTAEGAVLLDPRALPRLSPQLPSVGVSHLTQLYRRLFQGEPLWTPRPVDRLVEFYAELNDQKAAASKSCGRWPILFEVTTPLTKDEVCYAVETALRLHGVALVKDEGNRFTAIRVAELRSREARKAAASGKLEQP
jgi:hypothetical protein